MTVEGHCLQAIKIVHLQPMPIHCLIFHNTCIEFLNGIFGLSKTQIVTPDEHRTVHSNTVKL